MFKSEQPQSKKKEIKMLKINHDFEFIMSVLLVQ